MSLHGRMSALGLGLTSLLLLSALSVVAQDSTPVKPADTAGTKSPAKKRAYDPSRRVPDYFAQLGLTSA